jgi:hypothetical protein
MVKKKKFKIIFLQETITHPVFKRGIVSGREKRLGGRRRFGFITSCVETDEG